MNKIAVIGDPIAHTLSPHIHGAILTKLNIPHQYEVFQVKKGELPAFLEYAKSNLLGFNVTMPHKQDIIEYLDEIDAQADAFNSVNTVKCVQGKLIGYNTDGTGFHLSLKNAGGDFNQAVVVILGAGGAAATLAKKAAQQGANRVIVLNRNLKKAQLISSDFDTLSNIEKYMNCDILINATPLGMHGAESDFSSLNFLELLPRTTIVCDLIYNPQRTRLLQHADKLGYITINGMGMLVYQALLADQIFFDG